MFIGQWSAHGTRPKMKDDISREEKAQREKDRQLY